MYLEAALPREANDWPGGTGGRRKLSVCVYNKINSRWL